MKYSLSIIALLIVFSTYGQKNKTIELTGIVVEKTSQQPLEFATIVILSTEDSSIVAGGSTNELGSFEVNVKPGVYNIRIEFIGFVKSEIKGVSMLEDMKLPNITLEQDTEVMEAINITGEKSTIEYKLDKRVFNVGKDIISKGGSATDVLSNVPSVNVDATGEVSMRGNSGVRILINGKPSVLTTNGGLETIPSDNIEKIEVITNPSAKYDAEGTAGIINIILKKNKRSGFGSALQLSAGVPEDHSINYNVNYKTEKFNFFSNFRYSLMSYFGERSFFRTNFINDEVASFIDQSVINDRTRTVINIYGGGDYYIDDLNTLTLSYYYRHNTSKNTVNYNYDFLNAESEIDSSASSIEKYFEPQIANQIELNYIKEFNKKNQKLTVNLQYDFWNDDENERIDVFANFPSEEMVSKLESRDVESSDDFLFQSDFSLPLSDKSKLEMGVKGEIRRIDSDYQVWNSSELIDSLDNLLIYNESIFGAYTQYENSVHKLQYLIGIRAEFSDTRSSDQKDIFSTNKQYANIFPTAHLTYTVTDKTNLQLSYSKRIRRPWFWQLNPFGGIADVNNIRVGNPDLNPMYTDSYELGMLQKWEKFTLNPSIYFQQTTNLFETSVIQNSEGVLISKNINSGTEDRYGLEIVSTYSPNKWLRLSHEINFYGYEQKGIYNVKDNTFYTSLNSTFKFPAFNFQSSFDYEAGQDRGQSQSEDVFAANCGASKDLWSDKASISVNVRNLFNSRIYRDQITGIDYTLDRESFWSGRRIRATFTYRFNRTKNDRDRLPD